MAPYRAATQRAGWLQEAQERRVAVEAAIAWLEKHGHGAAEAEGEDPAASRAEGPLASHLLSFLRASHAAGAVGSPQSSGAGQPLGGADFSWLTGAPGAEDYGASAAQSQPARTAGGAAFGLAPQSKPQFKPKPPPRPRTESRPAPTGGMARKDGGHQSAAAGGRAAPTRVAATGGGLSGLDGVPPSTRKPVMPKPGIVFAPGGPCAACGTFKTPMWRKREGLTLCNACGVRASRAAQKNR